MMNTTLRTRTTDRTQRTHYDDDGEVYARRYCTRYTTGDVCPASTAAAVFRIIIIYTVAHKTHAQDGGEFHVAGEPLCASAVPETAVYRRRHPHHGPAKPTRRDDRFV